jgi:hypothetical protein
LRGGFATSTEVLEQWCLRFKSGWRSSCLVALGAETHSDQSTVVPRALAIGCGFRQTYWGSCCAWLYLSWRWRSLLLA